MKLSALNTIKYISYGFLMSLSTSHLALAEALPEGEQLQEKMQQQEKAYHAQQQQLMALDKKQDEQQTNNQRETERLQKELLAQEKNAYLASLEQQEAEEIAEKAALEELSQPAMETAYEKEQKFKQYDDRLDMQGSY